MEYSLAHAEFNDLGYHHMMEWGGYSYGGSMLLFVVLAVAGIVLLVGWSEKKHGQSNHPSVDTLKERYAKGEIDKKEFEEKKKDLME